MPAKKKTPTKKSPARTASSRSTKTRRSRSTNTGANTVTLVADENQQRILALVVLWLALIAVFLGLIVAKLY
jgi:hypothetical protein